MSSKEGSNKIFIGGLSYNTDDDKLRKHFSGYGTVQSAVVMRDPVSRRSRGFGFVTFIDTDALDRAIQAAPHTIDGREVRSSLFSDFGFDFARMY